MHIESSRAYVCQRRISYIKARLCRSVSKLFDVMSEKIVRHVDLMLVRCVMDAFCSGFAVGPLIGRHCGTKIPAEIQSSTGILSLSFHTDMAVAKDGFSARYNMTVKEVNDSKCPFVCFPPYNCMSLLYQIE